MANSPSHESAYKVLERPEVVYRREIHGGYTPYNGFCREPGYYPSYPPTAAFGRVAWDYAGLYAPREPYYQTLLSLHAARGTFLPRTFKSFYADEEKPNQSYIGLIGQAIMSSPEKKLVLSDIYKWVLQNYAYFRNKGPGWKNSVRHNLSLNDCFVKAGRSPNGKGNYWAINPENYDDFRKGDFRRRRAQRRAKKSTQIDMKTDDIKSHLESATREANEFPRGEQTNASKSTKSETKIRTFDVENLLKDEQRD